MLTPGAANVANITAGTGATAGGLNAAAAAGDVVFWAGSAYADKATANFNVTAGGTLTAKAGTVGGWTLASDSLSGGNVYLHNTGYVRIGAATADRLWLSAVDTTYRIWVGNDTAASAPFRVQKTGAFHFGSSTNYVSFDGTTLSVAGSVTVSNSIPYSSVSGLGSLATANSVDLSTSQVTNKSLANLDSTANTKLSGIAAGATVGAGMGNKPDWQTCRVDGWTRK